MTKRDRVHGGWGAVAVRDACPSPTADLETKGPVRQLLMSGERDDGGWGFIGAFWLSIDGRRGGFIVSPESLWHGSEMVRSLPQRARSRLDRGADLLLLGGSGRHRWHLHDRSRDGRGEPGRSRPPCRGALAAIGGYAFQALRFPPSLTLRTRLRCPSRCVRSGQYRETRPVPVAQNRSQHVLAALSRTLGAEPQ